MSGSLHAYPHAHSSLLQVSIEALCLSITVVQFLFTTLTGLFHKKCNRLKARVVIYAYQHHVRLLSPEPLVVKQPKFTRVEEPTLLCNQPEKLVSVPRIWSSFVSLVRVVCTNFGRKSAFCRSGVTSWLN